MAEKGDIKEYFEELCQKAKKGDEDALHSLNKLGDKYFFGCKTVEKNLDQALVCYTIAANLGDACAQYSLGYLYDNGWGLEQNFAKAIEWYTKSAKQDYSDAQFALGYLYATEDEELDLHKAFDWFMKSAKQDNVDAQFWLGQMFFCGEGTEKNDAKAFEWWKKASDQGDALAQVCLSYMYKNGDYVNEDDEKAKLLWNEAKNRCDYQEVMDIDYMFSQYRCKKQPADSMEKKDIECVIKRVDIVAGSTIMPHWKKDMQKISTNNGVFIANLPIAGGDDWIKEIGRTVVAEITTDSKEKKWIKLKSDKTLIQADKKVENIVMGTTQEKLPADYDINDNQELKLTFKYIKQNEPLIFLTGGAGTGKSTFIKYLKNNLKKETGKNCIVLAPTGIAAINVGGQTIHSFFNFPFDPFDEHDVINKMRPNTVLKYIDLIIIDEISMVRSCMLDHIDYALRLWCNKEQPFGGKQVLLIGDCFQLPPVRAEENNKLSKKERTDMIEFFSRWNNPFFFAAKALEPIKIKAVQLKQIYRQQSEKYFIHMLNRIRKRDTGFEKDIDFLNEKCLVENRTKAIPEECLLLTTTNDKADGFNNKKLEALQREKMVFKAFINGEKDDFDSKGFLTPNELKLCIGAQVMVTKNITSQALVNGDMGKVVGFGGDGYNKSDYVEIEVKQSKYRLTRETWNSVKYKWDDNKAIIRQEIVGSFSQIPLRLGWAVTIHKSQGLTLDSVAIDATNAWDSGQVYVALSRARSLNGIFLCSKLTYNSVKVDKFILQKYDELFPEVDKENIYNPDEYKNIILDNSKYTVDKSMVIIGGIKFELYPKNLSEKSALQNHVKEVLSVLLLNDLIPDAEMNRLLTDRIYCSMVFGLVGKTKMKIPYVLLSKNKEDFYDDYFKQYRCWKDAYQGYYICSQWYQNNADKFAKWLNDLSEGKLNADSLPEGNL